MTLLAAGFTRLARRMRAPPQTGIRLAIVASALVFGVAHLPALTTAAGTPGTDTALFVVIANAAFGLAAGWLCWRRGLEAAILAHILAHAASAHAVG
jgi:membrane protease YdiL (CAAX protease family)